MDFDVTEISLPSADGKHMLHGEIYVPREGAVRGVIQLAHGMADHVGRYRELAAYVTARGYVFAGHCHLGHGKSAASPDELGFFADRNGAELLIEDMHAMNRLLRERFSDAPIAVFGHSMGSFIARLYAVKYPDDIAAVIIHGSGGAGMRIPLGRAIIGIMILIKGKKHKSDFIRSLCASVNNSPFSEESVNAWLTRDALRAAEKSEDRFGSFTFTLSAYGDVLKLVGRSNSRSWFKKYPRTLPTLIVSGSEDAVGNFGKGVRKIYGRLLKSGHSALTLKIYDGARHELFNETNREDFFAYIADWLGGVI